MSEIRYHAGHVQNNLQSLTDALRGRPGMDPANITQMEEAIGETQQIKTVLEQFQISDRNDSQAEGSDGPANPDAGIKSSADSAKNETYAPEYASSISTVGG
jgi:hypothetical protein